MQLSLPEVAADQSRWRALMREHAQLEPLYHASQAYEALLERRMHEIKQLPIMAEGGYEAKQVRAGVLEAVHSLGEEQLLGIFNATGKKQAIATKLPEGIYQNLYDGSEVQVYSGIMRVGEITIIHK